MSYPCPAECNGEPDHRNCRCGKRTLICGIECCAECRCRTGWCINPSNQITPWCFHKNHRDTPQLFESAGNQVFAQGKCVLPDCRNIRYMAYKASYGEPCEFCEMHKCTCCSDRRLEDSMVCMTHKCALCNQFSDGLGYCATHRCEVPSCSNPKVKGLTICAFNKSIRCSDRALGSRYCSTHKCEVPLCGGPKTEGSDFCVCHRCPLCNPHFPRDPSPPAYCDKHRCSLHGCMRPRCPELISRTGSAYCEDHKCSFAGDIGVWDRRDCGAAGPEEISGRR
jgi:hypothetical protein